MKVGDVVTFVKEDHRYAQWFLYQIGIVKEMSQNNSIHCRVEWIQPVPYHDSFAKVSDFKIECYEVHDEKW